MAPQLMKAKKGFTLIEVIIVLIIIGILSGIAIPIYLAQVQKTRELEALRTLGAIRASLGRWYSINGSYTNAELGDLGSGNCNLDYCPNRLLIGTDFAGQTIHFTYTLTVTSPTTYQLFATSTVTDYISIDEAGQIQKFGIFA